MKINRIILTELDVVRVEWPKTFRKVDIDKQQGEREYIDCEPYDAKFYTKLLIHDNSSDKTQIKFIGKKVTIYCDVIYVGFCTDNDAYIYLSTGTVTIDNNKKSVEQAVKVKTTLEIVIANNPDDYDSVSINGVYFVRGDDE